MSHRTLSPSRFDAYVAELESLYQPRWSVYEAVAGQVARNRCGAVLDFGCGTGRLSEELARRTRVRYVGLERDPQRAAWATRMRGGFGSFTTTSQDALQQVAGGSRLAFTSCFCLHDQKSLGEVQDLIRESRPAVAVAWDLTEDDLPRLTATLRAALGAPDHPDPRTRSAELRDALLAGGGKLQVGRTQRHQIVFPTTKAVRDYVTTFELDRGDDLGLPNTAQSRYRISSTIERLPTPFVDQRSFMTWEVGLSD